VINGRARIGRAIFECNAKRWLYHWNTGYADGYVPFMHAECACNELAGLVYRHLRPVPLPDTDSEIFKVFTRYCKIFAKQASLRVDGPWTYQDVINHYSGKRRQAYESAFKSLIKDPIQPDDARVRMFIKGDKLDASVKGQRAYPRCIQYRGTRYCLELARYVKPLDYFLFNYRGPRRGVPASRMITKGLGRDKVGDLTFSKWSNFKKPIGVSIDFSKMDAHEATEVLDKIDGIYLGVHGNEAFLRTLLSWRKVNKCRSSNGLKYEVQGTRMSGDLDTSTGNCLIAMLALIAVLKVMGIRKWDAIIDGDDVVLIFEESDERFFDHTTMSSLYLGLGFEVEITNRYERMEDIIFCQSKFVEYATDKWMLVQDYRKVLSGGLDSHRHYHSAGSEGVLKSIGECYHHLYKGIPVLGLFFKPLTLLNVKGAKIENTEVGLVMARNAVAHKDENVTYGARLSFQRAFGLSVAEQLQLESRPCGVRWHKPDMVEAHIVKGKHIHSFRC